MRGNSEDKFEMGRKLYAVPQPEQELFPPEPQEILENGVNDLVRRGMKALKWAQVEYTIAKNTFPPGHRLRKQKLAERVAVGRWIKDVMNFLETGELPDRAAPEPEPEPTIERGYYYKPGEVQRTKFERVIDQPEGAQGEPKEKTYGYPPASNHKIAVSAENSKPVLMIVMQLPEVRRI